MGVRLSRWVTMHGFAVNLDPEMKYFDGMIPCGIFNYGVTSIHAQGVKIPMETLLEHIIASFSSLFEGENYGYSVVSGDGKKDRDYNYHDALVRLMVGWNIV